MKYFRIIGIAVLTLALVLTLMTACKKSEGDGNDTSAEVTTVAGEEGTKEVWTGKYIDDTKKPQDDETEPPAEVTREGNDYNGGGIELPPDKNV